MWLRSILRIRRGYINSSPQLKLGNFLIRWVSSMRIAPGGFWGVVEVDGAVGVVGFAVGPGVCFHCFSLLWGVF